MSYRLRGFLIHLAVSVALGLTATGIIFLIWYPSPLEQAIGVTSIVLILLGVDVVAGPLLTFAVCKQGKKSLKYDLMLIVLVQISAFIYGIHIIAQGRPVWIVFNKDSFVAVQAFEMKHNYMEKAKSEYQVTSFSGPGWVALHYPSDTEQKRVLYESAFKGVDLPRRADFYEPIGNQMELIKQKAQELSQLNQFNKPEEVKVELAKWPEANAFLPLNAREIPVSVLIKRETGVVVAIVNLKPWSN
jgi:hypothetical protein